MKKAHPPPAADRPASIFDTGRWNLGAKVYLALGSAVVAGYAYGALTGRDLFPEEPDRVPPEARGRPESYRAHAFWLGYHGGK